MRDGEADQRAISGAAERAQQPVEPGLERAADAGLDDDDGGEHRPIALRQAEQLRQREGDEARRGHADSEAQLGAVAAQPGPYPAERRPHHGARPISRR